MAAEKVTAQQLAEITRLHNAAQELSRDINEKYSSLLSAVVFPYILQTILLTTFLETYAHWNPSSFMREYMPVVNQLQDALEKLAQQKEYIKTYLKSLAEELKTKGLTKGHKLDTTIEILRFIEQSNDYYFTSVKKGVKALCASQYENEHFAAPPQHLSLESLCVTALKNTPNKKGIVMSSWLFSDFIPWLNVHSAAVEFIDHVSFPKIFATWLGKRFITDPLLQRFMTNGVEPLPQFLEFKTKGEATAIIKKLKTTESQLKKPAKRAATFSIGILPVLALAYFGQKIMGIELPQTAWLMFFCLIFSSLKHSLSAAKDIYDTRYYHEKLERNFNACKQLFNSYAASILSQDYGSLKSSDFFITFKKYQNLTPIQVCRTITQILANNGIVPRYTSGDTLWLRAILFSSTAKIKKIHDEIKEALENKKTRSRQKDQRTSNEEQVWEEIESKTSVRRRKAEKPLPVASAAKTPASPAQEINWPSSKNHPTSLIINSPGKNRFTLFNLRPNDFPSEASYNKFQTLIEEDPRVVPARGAQGLVYSKKFGGTLKAKALGEFGNVRIYATQRETAETGETRYIFNRLVLKAH